MYPYYDEIPAQGGLLRRLFYRLLPIPLHTFYPLRSEIYLFLIRLAGIVQHWRVRKQSGLLVNIGAGAKGKPGWVNIDMVKAPSINCLYDCRKRLPFPDGSVRGIFCEHFLEHLDYSEEAPHFLHECLRVLQPGGVLRIIVPDAEKYLHAYTAPGWEELAALRPLEEGNTDHYYKCRYRTKMELINLVFRQGHHHKYAYDFETLDFLLHRYGFAYVIRQEFGQTLLPGLGIDSIERATESLYIEAVAVKAGKEPLVPRGRRPADKGHPSTAGEK
jgi:predicted SAM-dependent methyltransferase